MKQRTAEYAAEAALLRLRARANDGTPRRGCAPHLAALLTLASLCAGPSAGLAAITVAAGGDVMLGTDYPDDTLPDDDGASFLHAVAHTLRGADLAFINLEGTLLDGGEPEKLCSGRCYFFRSPVRYVHHLSDAGIDLVSLGNNHARDFGDAGLESTQHALADAGIAWSGPLDTVASVERGSLRIAMIAFAPNPGLNPLLDIDVASDMVRAQAQLHDIVIVSFHGGTEGQDALHVGDGMEVYLGEDRGDLRAFTHAMVDAGADLLLGHGPHVPRGLELYQDRLIAYSLGNFATYYGISVAGRKGVAPLLVARLDDQGRFLGGRIVSLRQQRPQGPLPDADAEALHLMRRLSATDFPDSPLRIRDDGRLSP